MCLAFVLKGVMKEFPLVLMFNRDEDYDRPTSSAHWWQGKNILAGKDELKGGTWAAVSRHGRFGMLTFIRRPRENLIPTIGRGEIVPQWMKEEVDYSEMACYLLKTSKDSLGYNLLFGNANYVLHYDNRNSEVKVLEKGIHGVSNAYLNTPWFKVVKGKKLISDFVARNHELDSGSTKYASDLLFTILRDDELAPDELVQVTGLSPEREKLKSALFIDLPDYGTICSTVVLYHKDGTVYFYERRFARKGKQTGANSFQFNIS